MATPETDIQTTDENVEAIPFGFINEVTWHEPYKTNIVVAKRFGMYGHWKIYLYRGETPPAWKDATFTTLSLALKKVRAEANKHKIKIK